MKLAAGKALPPLRSSAAVLLMLVSVDDRVRDRFDDLAHGMAGIADRPRRRLSGALMTAARRQSIDNAPLLVFAVGGAVLVVFMVKT